MIGDPLTLTVPDRVIPGLTVTQRLITALPLITAGVNTLIHFESLLTEKSQFCGAETVICTAPPFVGSVTELDES